MNVCPLVLSAYPTADMYKIAIIYIKIDYYLSGQ